MIDLKTDYVAGQMRLLKDDEQRTLAKRLAKAKRYCDWGNRSLGWFWGLYFLSLFASSFELSFFDESILIRESVSLSVLLFAPAVIGFFEEIFAPISGFSQKLYSITAIVVVGNLLFPYFNEYLGVLEVVAWCVGVFSFIVRIINARCYRKLVDAAIIDVKDSKVTSYLGANDDSDIEVLTQSGFVYDRNEECFTRWAMCKSEVEPEPVEISPHLSDEQLDALEQVSTKYKGFDCYQRKLSGDEVRKLERIIADKKDEMLGVIIGIGIFMIIPVSYLVYQTSIGEFSLVFTLSIIGVVILYIAFASGLLSSYRTFTQHKQDLVEQRLLYVFYQGDDIREAKWERCILSCSEQRWG